MLLYLRQHPSTARAIARPAALIHWQIVLRSFVPSCYSVSLTLLLVIRYAVTYKCVELRKPGGTCSHNQLLGAFRVHIGQFYQVINCEVGQVFHSSDALGG